MDEQLLEMLQRMGLAQVLTPEQIEQKLARIKVISEKFLAFVNATPEMQGAACLFGMSFDGDNIATLIGGLDSSSPVFDKIILRLAYNIEHQRENTYATQHFTREVHRGPEEDGTLD